MNKILSVKELFMNGRNSTSLKRTMEHNKQVVSRSDERVTSTTRDLTDKSMFEGYKKKVADVQNLRNQSPETLSIMAKQVKGENTDKNKTYEQIAKENSEVLNDTFKRIVCKKSKNLEILGTFPDIETAGEIVLATTLNPNKITDIKLNYSIDDVERIGDEGVRSLITDMIQKDMTIHYKILDELPEIGRNMFLVTGSDPRLTLSEAALDDIINNDITSTLSMENSDVAMDVLIDKGTSPRSILPGIHKFLGKENNVSMTTESIKSSGDVHQAMVDSLISKANIMFTDNVGVLGLAGQLKEAKNSIIKKGFKRGGSLSMESNEQLGKLNIFRDRTKANDTKAAIILPTRNQASRKGIGRTVVIKVPSEAVAPVCIPGNKEEHQGYFIMLDDKANFITGDMAKSAYDRLNENLHNNSSFTNSPITNVYRDLIGNGGGETCIDMKKLVTLYEATIEKQINDLFIDSLYGDVVEIPNINSISAMMFTRALRGQKTTLLYAPKEVMSYFSLWNDNFGLGKTLLDDLRIPISFRSILLYARTMGNLKNMIDITEAILTLDPNDPDPEQTIQIAKVKMGKLMANNFPLGEDDPMVLLDWIQKAGIRLVAKGHPDIPDMDVEYNKVGLQYSQPDVELENEIKEQIFGKIGVPAETVSQSYTQDFAIEVVKRSQLYSKRIIMNQTLFNPEITNYVRNIVYNDEIMRDEIKRILKENKAVLFEGKTIDDDIKANISEDDMYDDYIDEIISNLHVRLPKLYDGETSDSDAQFQNYVDRITAALDVIYNSDYVSDGSMPEISENIEFVKNTIKTTLIRSWCADNNYLPDLFKIVAGVDKDDIEGLIQSNRVQYEALYKLTIGLTKDLTELKAAGADDIKFLKSELAKRLEGNPSNSGY